MTLAMFGSLFGGIGLFLLGMRLMTDGMKYAAGNSLSTIIAKSTSTKIRGILSGAFLTSLVQSSGAVTVAAIGFVNAGLVDFGHAVSIIYGTNIGTTMTGWLVSLLGFHLDIKAFAVPAVGFGMFLRIISHNGRRAAMGDVFVGLGVFFLGIDILKNTFSGLGENMQIANLGGAGLVSVAIFIGIGFLLTFLMQSSSASIAIILTAVAGNVISVNDAAAVVIGANVGSTSTAALAVIGATPDAKRLAGAHVIFNIVTGIVAILMLPFMLQALELLEDSFGLEKSPTTLLALFHTTFNILGVIILYPMTNILVNFLKRRWRTEEEDEAVPRHLDKNVVGTPVLAIHSLVMELKRIGVIARRMGQGAISSEKGPSQKLNSDKNVIDKLTGAVGDFSNLLQRSHLPEELDNQLPNALRVSSYFRAVADLAIDVAQLQAQESQLTNAPKLADAMAHFKKDTVKILALSDNDREEYSHEECAEKLLLLKESYQQLKMLLLRAGTTGDISVSKMVNGMDLIARIRRIADQAEKGARYLADLSVVEAKSSEKTGSYD